jgi:hypothetical protein
MVGLIAPTLVALVAAIGLGGSVRALFSTRVRGWPAIVAVFALELALYDPPVNSQWWAIQVGPWLWVFGRLVLLGAICWNGLGASSRVVWPWRVAAAGIALNTLVVGVNAGHMPQSTDAALAVWGASHIDPTRLQNVAPLDLNTRLPWLADVLAEPKWLPRPTVVSVGDVLLALGMASWIFRAATLNTANNPRFVSPTAKVLQQER